jgi:branched-chain amino acid transport system ATP-binding protein
MTTVPLLEGRDVSVRYGSAQALSGVSLSVQGGTAVAVLGTNGAGKSTLARALSGLIPVAEGAVLVDGLRVTGQPAHRIHQLGVTYLPEGFGTFPSLTVAENLRLSVLRLARKERADAIAYALDLAPALKSRLGQQAGTLSGGERQMLALARALSTRPRLVLIDELSLGLAPQVVEAVYSVLDTAREESQLSVVLIEQFVHRALAFAQECVILRRGAVVWSGPAAEALQGVADEYLGAGS